VAEAAANVVMTDRLRATAKRLSSDAALGRATAVQDAAAAMQAVAAQLYR
jgi:hypothetical protein